MRGNGKDPAYIFLVLSGLMWAALVLLAASHIQEWNRGTPFSTADFMGMWCLISVVWGAYAGIRAWWQTTAEHNPWKLLTLRQAIGWGAGFFVYILAVTVYYLGVMLALLMALEATIQRISTFSEEEMADVVFGPLDSNAMPYLVMISFMVVAVAQVMIVGTPMSRWIIVRLNAWLGLDVQE